MAAKLLLPVGRQPTWLAVRIGGDPSDGAAPSVPPVERLEPAAQRRVGDLLHSRIDRGVHDEPTLVQAASPYRRINSRRTSSAK